MKDENDDNDQQPYLQDVADIPSSGKGGKRQQKHDAGGRKLFQHGHGKHGPRPADLQTRLDLLLENFNVVLEFTRQKLAGLVVKPGDVGGQRQDEDQQKENDRGHHWRDLRTAAIEETERLLLRVAADRSMSASGRLSSRRRRSSRRAMRPLSRSWS